MWAIFFAVDFPSFHSEDQKNLHCSCLVQGLNFSCCKCCFHISRLIYCSVCIFLDRKSDWDFKKERSSG